MAFKNQDEAREAILKEIAERAPTVGSAGQLRDLAEAFAWVISPSQPHGGHQ